VLGHIGRLRRSTPWTSPSGSGAPCRSDRRSCRGSRR
jgi:hypothetical protein